MPMKALNTPNGFLGGLASLRLQVLLRSCFHSCLFPLSEKLDAIHFCDVVEASFNKS
jgi:hypothetical protein